VSDLDELPLGFGPSPKLIMVGLPAQQLTFHIGSPYRLIIFPEPSTTTGKSGGGGQHGGRKLWAAGVMIGESTFKHNCSAWIISTPPRR
jgi:hypothetical protein